MIDFDYLQSLVGKLLDKKGRLNSLKMKYNPQVIEELNNIEFLKQFPTLVEKSCAIRDRLSERIKCRCGELTNYDIGTSKYNRFCSNKCPQQLSLRGEQIKAGVLAKYGVENVSQVEEINNRRINNNLEKYGVKSTAQLEEVKEKSKKTNLEKYGVEYSQQSREIREKVNQTNLERYGNISSLGNSDVREKAKRTNLEKYGKEICQQSEIVINKTRETNLEKYGTVAPTCSDEIKEKIKRTNLEKYGNEFPQKLEEFRLKSQRYQREFHLKYILPIKLLKIKELYNIIPYNWNLNDYENTKEEYKFSHIDCGKIFESNLKNGKFPKCPKCHRLYGISKIELKLRNDLINLLGEERVDYSNRKLINPYELDIILDDRLAIEVNGTYWHREDSNSLSLLEKSKLSPIPVLHFWDFELENKYEICKSIILSKLGLYEERIFARKCEIRQVDSQSASDFLEYNHLQGRINSKYNYGLYYNNDLVSLMTLGKSRFNKNYDYEILRFASKLNTQIIGGVSKLFKKVMEDFEGNSILTYADKRYSNGDIYSHLQFEELNDSFPNYYWCRDNEILSRYQTQKHKLSKFLKLYDEKKSESENMMMNNYYKISDCGNKVFAINLK